MIKKGIVFLLILVSFIECSQTSNNNKMEKEKLLNLYKEIKIYDYNPIYWIDFRAIHCSYEILLNDMPIVSNFKPSKTSGASIPLNSRILLGGQQKLTIRIYPNIKDNILETSLTSETKFSFDITFGEFGKEKVKDYHKVISFVTPDFSNSTPFYEKHIFFSAKIPYNLKGWQKSVDLTKEDKEKLKTEVEKIYTEFASYYTNKNIEKLCNKYYNREKEIAQSLFLGKKSDSEELVRGIEEDLKEDMPFKLEKYELRFFGDGKVVGLIRVDFDYRGESALLFENDENYSHYSLLLHRPFPNAPLEVIR